MRNVAAFVLPVLLCCCSKPNASQEIRKVSGVLQVHSIGGGAFHARDDRGQPIFVILYSERAEQELRALAPSAQQCSGALYDAMFLIRGERRFRGLRAPSAELIDVLHAAVSKRSDTELQALLHKFDLSLICPQCEPRAQAGQETATVKRIGNAKCARWG